MWGPCAYDPTVNTLHSSLGGSGFIIMLCISFTCPIVGGCCVNKFYVTSRLSCLLWYCITAVKGSSPGRELQETAAQEIAAVFEAFWEQAAQDSLQRLQVALQKWCLESKGAKGACVDVQGAPVSVRKPDFITQVLIHVITEGLLRQFKQVQTEIGHDLVREGFSYKHQFPF